MSAFLGPIHYLMYARMLYTEQLTAAYTALQPDLAEQMDAMIEPLSTEDLADIVDESNIHGWLSAAIARAESRLSWATEDLPRETLVSVARKMGAVAAEGMELQNPAELAAALRPFMLDGMPCDWGMEVDMDEEAGRLFLRQQKPVHEEAFGPEGVERFYSLRCGWLEGFTADSGWQVEDLGHGNFVLTKE